MTMNLDTLSSPGGEVNGTNSGPTASSCSLSSILGLGVCRSRAEAAQSFAKKLQTKLWSLGPSTSSNGLAGSEDAADSSWASSSAVAVEARLDLSRGVVTTVPVTSPSSRVQQLAMEKGNDVDRQQDRIKVAQWMGSSSYGAVAAPGDQAESDASSTTTTNPLSDSDQYFDFGIETPLDGDSGSSSSTGDEPTLVNDHNHIVINHDDGLPVQPESGCIFGSPVLSGEESDEVETSYYESLSQSPASTGFMAPKEVAQQQQQDQCSGLNDKEPVAGQVGREKTAPPGSPDRLFSLAHAQQHHPAPERDGGARVNSQGYLEDIDVADLPAQQPSPGVYLDECESGRCENESLSHDAPLACVDFQENDCNNKMVVVVKPQLSLPLDSIHQLFDSQRIEDDGVVLRPATDEGCAATDHVRPDTNDVHAGDLEGALPPSDRYVEDAPAAPSDDPEAPSSKETSVSPSREDSTTDGDLGEECDADDEQLYRPRVQRSTSLKTGKTPPGTPGRKKIVRFADALGLDLALVRTFLDEVPNVPPSAFSDLNGLDSADAEALLFGSSPRSVPSYLPIPGRGGTTAVGRPGNALRSLVASFAQPGSLPNFLELVKHQKVCLETACLVDDMRLRGVVRVLNLDFHKSVVIRFTTDEWTTQSDQMAVYVPGSCDGLSDRFSFTLTGAQSLQPGQRLIFALCYRVGGQEIWDSNQGRNYVFQCISSSSYVPSIALQQHHQSPDHFSRHDSFLPYM